ncbi:MmcQ/YjbR family DNA-binding protein [Nocardia sp. NPDC050630]|uniref:MmcQ/YjbR family DNA-binding protein n=1 Tax=Nocardia sp. NPDC050630 TaxID=3364321 RepID=UPI00378B295E
MIYTTAAVADSARLTIIGPVVTSDDVRRIALSLPRTTEALVRDRVKFRVGRIVYLALSTDEARMGFAFPKQERAALVAAEPDKFLMPLPRDERYNWVRVRLDAIDETELTELVIEAWRMVVPKRVAAAHLGD